MTDRHTLIAFLAVVGAIVVLAALAAYKGQQTDLAIMTGLIGVLGTFKPRSTVPASNVENAETVNQTTEEPAK